MRLLDKNTFLHHGKRGFRIVDKQEIGFVAELLQFLSASSAVTNFSGVRSGHLYSQPLRGSSLLVLQAKAKSL